MELKVDNEKLESEIANLNTLLSTVKEASSGNIDTGSKGKASEFLTALGDSVLGLEQALQTLISMTILFCENSKDGFLDLDESTSNLLKTIKEQFN